MSDWTMGRINQIADITMGQSPVGANTNSQGDGDPLLNGPSEFGVRYPTPVQWTTASPRSCQTGDLLFCVRGSTTGRMNLADQKYAIGRGLASMRGATSSDTLFAKYAIQNSLPDLLAGVTGSVFPNLSRNQIGGHQLLLPPVPIRAAIAEVLGALDDKIAANTKLAATVEALGAAKIRALGINDEPESGYTTLDTLFDFNPRRSISSDSVTVIDMQALPTSEPLIETWAKGPKRGGARFMNGDTLLARITPCLENRKTGFVDFLSNGEVGIGSTEFVVIRSRESLPLGLSYFVATSSRFRDFAIQNMVGTSGRQRVAAADVARFEFNPIDHSDLMEFGKWADRNLCLLGSLRNENKTLATTRDSLLPQLMSGKLQVKDAEALALATI